MQYISKNTHNAFTFGFFPSSPSDGSDDLSDTSTKLDDVPLMIETCFQGNQSPSMVADFCWRLKRNIPEVIL